METLSTEIHSSKKHAYSDVDEGEGDGSSVSNSTTYQGM